MIASTGTIVGGTLVSRQTEATARLPRHGLLAQPVSGLPAKYDGNVSVKSANDLQSDTTVLELAVLGFVARNRISLTKSPSSDLVGHAMVLEILLDRLRAAL